MYKRQRSGNDWLIFGSKIYSGLAYNDRVLIEDANSSYVKKYTTLSDVKNWVSNNIIPSQALSIVYETPDQQWGLNDYFKPLFINGRAYLTTTNQVATLVDLANQLATARTITIGSTGKSFDGSSNISFTLGEIGAAAASHTHTKSQITDFSHTHPISDITNLQTSLDGKVNTSDVVTTATANKILKLDSSAKLPASITAVSYTHLRAHETVLDLVCRLLLEKKKKKTI